MEPFATGWLDTEDGHEIYWERIGTPGAQPAVALHGGPGSGASVAMRELFDPARFDVLIFDQRGAGRSRPAGSLANNTSRHLVADIERLRAEVMRTDAWVVVGGSWGSLLALLYAQAHPQRVRALVLRGVFTGTRAEMDWFYGGGLRQVFPDKWEAFMAPLPESGRHDVLGGFDRLLNGADPDVAARAAAAWCAFEEDVSAMEPAAEPGPRAASRDLAYARTQVHYFRNGCFIGDGELLARIERVRKIPAAIVHGRFDMTCPIEYAWQVHRAWPEAKFTIVEMAGHSIASAAMMQAYKAAIDAFGAAASGP